MEWAQPRRARRRSLLSSLARARGWGWEGCRMGRGRGRRRSSRLCHRKCKCIRQVWVGTRISNNSSSSISNREEGLGLCTPSRPHMSFRAWWAVVGAEQIRLHLGERFEFRLHLHSRRSYFGPWRRMEIVCQCKTGDEGERGNAYGCVLGGSSGPGAFS